MQKTRIVWDDVYNDINDCFQSLINLIKIYETPVNMYIGTRYTSNN